ncbi:hypothetical protein Tco_1031837 [Tanacetum coccineum]|uniref:Uncharacterized protein n=2 Tax=Tanacetum coccineum TaxID=301880 RepID=A0ABQ5GBH9_9ASTR
MDGKPMEINMLVEKKYPLIKELLEKMLNLQLEAEEESTMAFELIKFIKSLLEEYMRMKQYLTHTDYALWEVIVNGDAPIIASVSTEGPIPPKTAEQKLARKHELKAKSTLLLAIPDEHILKFHGIKDEKNPIGSYTRQVYKADLKSKSAQVSNSQKVAFVSQKTLAVLMNQLILLMKYSTPNSQDKLFLIQC